MSLLPNTLKNYKQLLLRESVKLNKKRKSKEYKWTMCGDEIACRRKVNGPSIQELIEKEYNSELIGQLR